MNMNVVQTQAYTPYHQAVEVRKKQPLLPSAVLCDRIWVMHPGLLYTEILDLVARMENNQIN